MSTEYDFKRSFYYDAEKAVEDSSVSFLLGARKCGKTVCMKQLADSLSNAEYFDIKSMDADDVIDLRDEIISCIGANANKIFLVDEATYFDTPEKVIAKIANKFTDCRNTNTRVVCAGSQSVALEAWASRACAGNASFVYADFLSYPEWLAYKGIDEVSEKTYNQFVLGTREFYRDFVSLDQYLKGCLEETITSNFKTSNVILNNSCDRLNEKILKNILYAALIAQGDRLDIIRFFDKNKVFREVRSSFKSAFRAIGGDEVQKRIDEIFSNRLEAYSSLDMETFRQGLIFLYRSGLITLTYVSDETRNFENIADVYRELCFNDSCKIKTKRDLFEKVNISIKYPMFYAEILKEILLGNMPDELKDDILGGIIECHTRGGFCHKSVAMSIIARGVRSIM